MGVRVISTLGDLGRDLRSKPRELRTGGERVVRNAARDGVSTAKRITRARYGRGHAKLYPGTMSEERTGVMRREFGPEARGQGNLAPILEGGSRNNPAHMNIASTYDLIRPGFHRSVNSLLNGLFW